MTNQLAEGLKLFFKRRRENGQPEADLRVGVGRRGAKVDSDLEFSGPSVPPGLAAISLTLDDGITGMEEVTDQTGGSANPASL